MTPIERCGAIGCRSSRPPPSPSLCFSAIDASVAARIVWHHRWFPYGVSDPRDEKGTGRADPCWGPVTWPTPRLYCGKGAPVLPLAPIAGKAGSDRLSREPGDLPANGPMPQGRGPGLFNRAARRLSCSPKMFRYCHPFRSANAWPLLCLQRALAFSWFISPHFRIPSCCTMQPMTLAMRLRYPAIRSNQC